jgi:hypothetical protein
MCVLANRGSLREPRTKRPPSEARSRLGHTTELSVLLYVRIIFALASCAGLGTNINAQRPQPALEIDAQQLHDAPFQARFTHRPAEIPIQIKGDARSYRWVRIANARDLRIRVTGQPEGYANEQSIQIEHWYQFKTSLPLTLMVGQGNEEAYDIKLEFGRLKTGAKPPPDSPSARSSAETGQVEWQEGVAANIHLVDDSRPIVKVNPTSVGFYQPQDPNAGLPEQTLELTGVEPGGSAPMWRFVRLNLSSPDIDIVIGKDADKTKSTPAPGDRLDGNRFFGFLGSIKLVLTKRASTDHNPAGLSLETARGLTEPVTREDAMAALKKPDDLIEGRTPIRVPITTTMQSAPSEPLLSPINIALVAAAVLAVTTVLFAYRRLRALKTGRAPGNVPPAMPGDFNEDFQYPPGTTVVAGDKHGHPKAFPAREKESFAEQERTRMQRQKYLEESGQARPHAPDSGLGAHTLRQRQLEDETALIERLKQRLENVGLSKKARVEVDGLVRPTDQGLEKVRQEMVQVRKLLQDHTQESQRQADDQKARLVEQQRATQAALSAQLDQALKLLVEDSSASRRHFEERFREIKDTLASDARRQPDGDPFYAGLLGQILGHSVEPLQDDNFAGSIRVAAKGLDRFFREQIPRAEVLDSLTAQAESIRTSLKALIDRASMRDGQAEKDVAQYLRNVMDVATELSAMQSQLRSRQLTLELAARLPLPGEHADMDSAYDSKLRASVSAHPSARYSFLEELGFAVKREIDKLRDPQSYFRRQLEKLATSDLVAVAEICDKQAGGPGKNAELELSLQTLFSHSGLRSILPRPKDPFKAAEQNLIQIISGGGPADSQKISRVVSRGFFYKNGENERLLRKAGVEVYR